VARCKGGVAGNVVHALDPLLRAEFVRGGGERRCACGDEVIRVIQAAEDDLRRGRATGVGGDGERLFARVSAVPHGPGEPPAGFSGMHFVAKSLSAIRQCVKIQNLFLS